VRKKHLEIDAPSDWLRGIYKGKINPSTKKVIPKDIATYLAHLHYDHIQHLSDHFGGHANDWFNDAKELVHNP